MARFYVLLLITLLVPLPVAGQNDMGTWISRPALPTPRQEMPHVMLNGEVYVLGGINAARSSSELVEAYNPETGQWSEKASLPPTLHHLGAAVVDGKIYVIGGYISGFSPTDRVFEYDPSTDGWTEKSAMPIRRGGHVAVTINEKIYVVGGEQFGGALTNNQVYDPATDTWEELAPMPSAREHLAAAALDGKMYVVGGRRREGGFLNNVRTVEVYDPATDTWDESPANLPITSGGLAVASLHGRLYAFGGEFFEDGDSGVYDLSVEYNPETNTWRNLAPMPLPRHGIGAVAVADTIFIIGGGPIAGFATTGVNSGFIPPKPIGTASGEESLLPDGISFLPNYPNPFQTSTTLTYSLPAQMHVRITMYDLLGRAVASLVNSSKVAGEHNVQWDAGGLPNGIYLVQFEADNTIETRMLIKQN